MRRRLLRYAALAGLLGVLVPLLVAATGMTTEARDRLVDLVVPSPPVSRDLAVVGVAEPLRSGTDDAADLDADRRRFQALVRTLEAVVARGPRLVVMTDVLSPEDLTADDGRALLQVLASGRVLLPYLDDVPVAGDGSPVRLFRTPLSATASLPLAHAVVEDLGPGGRVRTMAVAEQWQADGQDLTFFALPLAALGAVAAVPVERTDDAIRAGSVTVPLEQGRLRINYASRLVDGVPGAVLPRAERTDLPYVAAAALLADEVGQDVDISDRIVLVGSVDPRQAHYVVVPGGPPSGVPELWVHANALNTVLVDAPLAPATTVELLLWLVVTALVATVVALRRPPAESAVWLVPLGVLALVVVMVRGGAGTVVDPVALLLALAVAWAGTFAARYAVEGRQRRRVAHLFRRYVPDRVAAQLIEEEVGVAELAAGVRTEVTVVFCDLRGFTAQAGSLDPPRVRDLLNIYYRHTTGAILEHGGTVMQYVGDEVFAVFGAPLAQPDHTQRAVAAARDMQAAAEHIAGELAALGVAPVTYGIGVHTGPVVAAHVGDAARTQYAVVGDTVNVGARLCSQAGPGEVVVSQDVVDALDPAPTTIGLGTVPLKGVERDLAIHRLVASGDQSSGTQVPDG